MIEILEQRWNALSSREKLLAILLTGIVFLAVLYAWGIAPMVQRLATANSKIERSQRILKTLDELSSEYRAARARLAEVEQKMGSGKDSFSLLSFVEETSKYAHVRDRIASMQPQPGSSVLGYAEHTIEVRFEAITGSEALALLTKLERAPHLIRIKRLQTKLRYDAPALLDTTLLLSTYTK